MSSYADRLAALREQLKADRLDGFVVPLTDEHMSEYVGSYAQRLRWLTGFEGSAGSAVVLPAGSRDLRRRALHAAGPQPGRARKDWSYQSVPETSVADWLKEHAPQGARIGYDPVAAQPRLGEAGDGSACRRAARSWSRSSRTRSTRCGKTARRRRTPSSIVQPEQLRRQVGRRQKRNDIADWLAKQKRRRGGALGARFDRLGVQRARRRTSRAPRSRWPMRWSTPTAPPTCSSPARRSAPRSASISAMAFALHERDAFDAALGALKGKTVAVDPERAVAAIFEALDKAGAKIIAAARPDHPAQGDQERRSRSPARSAAQARDGAAIARFLHWVENEAPEGRLDELTASDHLEALRRENRRASRTCRSTPSRAPGPNGAIVHYRSAKRPTASSRPARSIWSIRAANMLDGTTDITRTVAIGEPTDEMRDRFTRVLKGHIAVATALFPKGTRGTQLDSFARRPLWEAGLDYAHGTGHGVGSFLSVHEGPQRISPAGSAQAGGDEPLRAGMILSNEPGYYKTGEYGIRIENLVLVVEQRGRGRRKGDARLRDADLRADRAAADRRRDCSATPSSRGSTPITPTSSRRSARVCERRRPGMARKAACAPL